jgi:NOL1/NOP2/fmu family ribosome biogenesis protein
MNQTMEKHISEIQQNLYIRSAGVYVGSAGNKGFIPEHGLAMSGNLPASFPRFELEREDALQLLRHQTVGADIKEKGWMLMTHKSHALSLVKSLPNRINNYYPREWRILNK